MGMEFTPPEFIDNNTPEEIQSRMMNALPEGIDDMPGGFPYDFTMPTAIEKSELIQFHLVRTLYAHVSPGSHGENGWIFTPRLPECRGNRLVMPAEKLPLPERQELLSWRGSIFCTASTDDSPSLEYAADHTVIIPDGGHCKGTCYCCESW